MGGGISGLFKGTKGNKPKLHKGRQNKHIKDTNNYKQQIKNGKHPSILKEDPSKLLEEGTGKGKHYKNGKEVVDYKRIIGEFYDRETGKYYHTTRGTIHYDSNGNAHIVPARPADWLK